MTGSLYGVLQIDESATKEEVRAAYRRLAGRFHPDVDSSPAAQQKLEVCAEWFMLLLTRGSEELSAMLTSA